VRGEVLEALDRRPLLDRRRGDGAREGRGELDAPPVAPGRRLVPRANEIARALGSKTMDDLDGPDLRMKYASGMKLKAVILALAVGGSVGLVLLKGGANPYDPQGPTFLPADRVYWTTLLVVAPLMGIAAFLAGLAVLRVTRRVTGRRGEIVRHALAGLTGPVASLGAWVGLRGLLHLLSDRVLFVPDDLTTRLWLADGGGDVSAVLVFLAPLVAFGAAVLESLGTRSPEQGGPLAPEHRLDEGPP